MVNESAEQLNLRLQEIEYKATKIRSEIEPLNRDREQALVAGNVSTSVVLRRRLNELRESLEDLDIAKAQIEARLRVYEHGAPEAAKIRDKVNALWDGEARPIVEELVKMQQRARVLHEKALGVENKISGFGHEYLRLVGRDMRSPPSITGTIFQLAMFAGASDVKPLDVWHYVGDEELAAQHKAELDKKVEEYQDRLGIANQLAPPCARCGEKTAVDTHAGMKERPGAGVSAGDWHFHCKHCGNNQGGIVAETRK